MKFVAIIIALLMAHQTCQSLPISDSSEEDSSDIMDDSSSSDDSRDSDDMKVQYSGRKFVKEFIVDPSEMKKGNEKGMNSYDDKKRGSENIELFLINDSNLENDDEIGNFDVDSDETEYVKQKSSSNEEDLNAKSNVNVLTQSFKRPKPAGEGTPYVRKANRDQPKQRVPFNRNVLTKESTPEEFEKQIEELKKDIQRMKVLDQSESSEEEKDEFVGELVNKIKSLRDEIRVEKGMEVEESDEIEKQDDYYDEYDSEEFSEETDSDEKIDDNSSEEQDGIKNIKLTQTFDGEDVPESEPSITENDNKDLAEFDQLVKIIQTLKQEIIEQRKLDYMKDEENLNDGDGDYIEEPVDEKLLLIFKNLEVNDDLKDIKHIKQFNNENNIEAQKIPLLNIEQPENLGSDEVKIGFIISNEDGNSDEDNVIDLLNASVESPPEEFPKKNFVEFIEIIEVPENEVVMPVDVKPVDVAKKFNDAKKTVPDQSITGGILSKVGSIFNFMKKQFL